jgi:hypothetical protein
MQRKNSTKTRAGTVTEAAKLLKLWAFLLELFIHSGKMLLEWTQIQSGSLRNSRICLKLSVKLSWKLSSVGRKGSFEQPTGA